MSKEGFKREIDKAESYFEDLDYMYLDDIQLKMFGLMRSLLFALKELEED